MDRIAQARENRMRRIERIRSNKILRQHNSLNNLVSGIRSSHESNEISHTTEDITMIRRLNEVMDNNSLRPSYMNNNYQRNFMLHSNVSANGELETTSLQSITTAISKDSPIRMGRKKKFQSGSTNDASCSNSLGISTTTTPRFNLFVPPLLAPTTDALQSIPLPNGKYKTNRIYFFPFLNKI